MSREITVFVSHSHRDIEIAEKMCEYLHQKGLTCWISSRNIPGGKWPDYVMHGINNCDVFVLIYSKYSNESGNVENEVINAAKTDALLIPFCLDSSEMNATLTLHLTKYEKVMVGDAPLEQKFDELYQKIAIAMDNGNFNLNRADKPENSQSSIVLDTDVNYLHNSGRNVYENYDRTENPSKISRRLIIPVAAIAAALIVVLICVFIGRNPSDGSSDDAELAAGSVDTETVEEELEVDDSAEVAVDEEPETEEIIEEAAENVEETGDEGEEDISEDDEMTNIPEDAVEYEGHYYRLYSTSVTWSAAEELCEERGGHLVTITSQEEQDFIALKILEDNGAYWTGGYYDISLQWLWITDEYMDYTCWLSDDDGLYYQYMTVTKAGWMTNKEDGGYYYGIATASTGYPSTVKGYICEWDMEDTVEDETEDLTEEETASDDSIAADIPEDAVEYEGHYYRLYATSVTWSAAEELCEERGGHLVTITSQEEQNLIAIKLLNDNGAYWIGGYYDVSMQWLWVTGEYMDYTCWLSDNDGLYYQYMTVTKAGWMVNKEDGGYYYGIATAGTGYPSTVKGYICEWE